MTLKVLLVDDHPVFRDGLRFILGHAEGVDVVDEAADGQEAVRLAEGTPYDVVVMDVRMPILDGIEATRGVVATGAKVLVLTMFEDDATVLSAMRAGASGYLVKGADAEQVVSAVTAVASGHAVFGPAVAGRMLRQFGVPAEPVAVLAADRLPGLSAREQEVLELLADGQDARTAARSMGISLHTCRSYIKNVLAKLDAHSQLEAVATATRVGIVHVPRQR
jgi:DNA-binding NarL/FixJ family response regulator